MSYYPTNFYSSYPYAQQGQSQPQYPNGPIISSQQQIMQQQSQAMQMQQPMTLQGKMVDGEDIVKVTDVPMGGYGVFPKADFSEVYIKSWNSNGTTNIVTYKPTFKETPKEDDTNTVLLDKMNQLEQKLDAILMPKTEAAANPVTVIKRKES